MEWEINTKFIDVLMKMETKNTSASTITVFGGIVIGYSENPFVPACEECVTVAWGSREDGARKKLFVPRNKNTRKLREES